MTMASSAITQEVVTCPNCGRKNRVPSAAQGFPRCGNCHQPLPWMADAGDDTFAEVAEAASVPVVVDLWAPWCGPCRMVSPVLAQLATDLAGRIKLAKVNVDESPRIQQRFGVQAIPTLMVLRHGQVAARRAGAAPATDLRKWVETAIAQ
jgi:thioredoxin 2